MRRVARFLAGSIIAIATIGVIVGLMVVFLLTPLWVYGEQDRVGSAALTGYTATEVRVATGAILADLIVGPPDLDVTIRDQPVLSEAERGHLRDVRTAFLALFAVLASCLAVLVLARIVSHGSILYWRAVRTGAAILAVAVAAIAGFAVVAFTLLFEVFHRLLFPPGTYTFNPLTDRLVQLFPERFWFDTTIVLAIGLIVFALGVRSLAGRRLNALRAATGDATAPPPPAPIPSTSPDDQRAQASPSPQGPAPADPTPVESWSRRGS